MIELSWGHTGRKIWKGEKLIPCEAVVEHHRPMSRTGVLPSLQEELLELVKREHAKIDSQNEKEKEKSGESKGAAAEAGPASAAPPSRAEE